MVTHNIHAQTIERTAIAASSGRGRVEWENLRKAVQSILNLKYGEWFMFALLPIHYYHYYARYGTAAAVGKPKARVSYSAISPSCVKGFPKGLKFGPPSSFSAENLRRIVDAAEDSIYWYANCLSDTSHHNIIHHSWCALYRCSNLASTFD